MLIVVVAFLASTLAFAQSSPLIMYHADNLEVARKRGTLVLYGNVHFAHDSVSFKTQRAFWNRNSETVECGGGFLFTHPSGYIRARNGSYQRKSEIAIASGEVSAGDSAGNYLMTGQYFKQSFIPVVSAVIFAVFAQQAGADHDLHSAPRNS